MTLPRPMKDSFRINSREAFLKRKPSSICALLPHIEQVTIGDLHGNSMKFIYFLIKNDIIEMEAEDYIKLDAIYEKDANSLTKEDLTNFKNILENKIVVNEYRSVRLLGDEFSDRGNNDYFTLKIMERLAPEVNFEFICSNHNIELIKEYEEGLIKFEPNLWEPQAQSLINLGILVKKGLVETTEVADIMKYMYYPNLKLISYSLNEEHSNISIYSHAPIGIKTVQAVAEFFKVEYKDATITELATTIEHINEEFSKTLKAKTFYQTSHMKKEPKADIENQTFDYPISRVLWTRGHDADNDPLLATQNRYKIRYVHGHDAEGKVPEEYKDVETNLDNTLGKGKGKDKGTLDVLITNHHQLISRESTEMIEFVKTNKLNQGNKLIQDELQSILIKSKNESHSEKINQAFSHLKTAWEKEDKKDKTKLIEVIELIKEIFLIRIEYADIKIKGGLFESKTIRPLKDQAIKDIEYTLLDALKNENYLKNPQEIVETVSIALKNVSSDFTSCWGRKSKLAKLLDNILEDHDHKIAYQHN